MGPWYNGHYFKIIASLHIRSIKKKVHPTPFIFRGISIRHDRKTNPSDDVVTINTIFIRMVEAAIHYDKSMFQVSLF